jgi:hypothetical protein
VNSQLRGFDDDVDVFYQVISPVHGFSVFHSTDQIVHRLHSTVQDFDMSRKSKSKTRPKHWTFLSPWHKGICYRKP